jgi:uncharacterized protein YbjT (DUF2867 family)
MKALIVGATGLVGRICLENLLRDDFYHNVEIWVRRTTGIKDPKLTEIIVDYTNLDNINSSGVNHVYCCLGTTIKKAGSQAEFRKVDYEYVLTVGRLAEKFNAEKFIVISSIGANPGSGNFYLRTKGEMEEDVKKLTIPAVYIVRPSFIMGEREEFRFGEKVGLFMIKGVNFLLSGKMRKYRGIKALTIAKAMISLARSGEQKKLVFESDKLQQLGK